MSVAIIDYGAGNIQSIRFCFDTFGSFGHIVVAIQKPFQSASHVIFPGVGEASSAMAKLKRT